MIDEKKLIEDMMNNDGIDFRMDFNTDTEDSVLESLREFADKFRQGMIELVKKQQKVGEWILVSERLPKERDWYLAVFKERDTGFIGLPYIADYLMGKHTTYTTNDGWIIKDCTDRYDCESEYHKGLECVAWMPLPEPYKE